MRKYYALFFFFIISAAVWGSEVKVHLPKHEPYEKVGTDDAGERIDYFTGSLTLAHTDFVLPGVAGMDISFTRDFNANNFYLGVGSSSRPPRNNAWAILGHTGWSFIPGYYTARYGKLLNNSNPFESVCEPGASGELQLPGGISKRFWYAEPEVSSDPLLISSDNWIVRKCENDVWGKPVKLTIHSPNGKKYILERFHEMVVYNGADGTSIKYRLKKYDGSILESTQELSNPALATTRFYVTEVSDVHGNAINYHYSTDNQYAPRTRLDRITSTDGRSIELNYEKLTNGQQHPEFLTSVEVSGMVWRYEYDVCASCRRIYGPSGQVLASHPAVALKRVIAPNEETLWKYINTLAGDVAWRHYSFSGFDTYNGAEYRYEYVTGGQSINYAIKPNPFGSHAVARKTIAGEGLDNDGVWEFDYSYIDQDPHFLGRHIVTTTIQGPDYTDEYQFVRNIKNADENLSIITLSGPISILDIAPHLFSFGWDHGLLLAETRYDGSNNEVIRKVFDWDYQPFVTDTAWHELVSAIPYYEDNNFTNRSLLVRETTYIDGASYETEYLEHNEYGSPALVEERGEGVRVTELAYYNNTESWFIGLLANKSVVGGDALNLEYNSLGQVLKKYENGIVTEFSYHNSGELRSEEDARGNTIEYMDYYRGVPRIENYPDSITVSRVVDYFGRVIEDLDGRGASTKYTYDELGRVILIDYPVGNDAHIQHSPRLVIVTQGNFVEEKNSDALGRNIEIVMRDDSVNDYRQKEFKYNHQGYRVFESYWDSQDGTTFSPDILGRLNLIEHADGSMRTISYWRNQIRIEDELGAETIYQYNSFGDFNERRLVKVSAPLVGDTEITRNIRGQIVSISQANIIRTLSYYPSGYLESLEDPEIGVTYFGRDEMGNMTSRKVNNSLATNYYYDAFNRIETIDNSDGTTSSYSYDENGNLIYSSAGGIDKNYVYDARNRLVGETLSVDGLSFSTSYERHGSGGIKSLTYPSGRVVDYAPNAYGWPTQASSHVGLISYYPDGQIENMNYLNGTTTSYTIDTRRRISTMTVGSGIARLNYNYDDANNVQSIQDVYDGNRSMQAVYDSLGRLTTVASGPGQGQYLYDALGNILRAEVGARTLNYNYDNQNLLISVDGSIDSNIGYDEYGNIASYRGREYKYDDASQMVFFEDISSGVEVEYAYNADGGLVRKYDGDELRYYFYSKAGDLYGIYDETGQYDVEYILLDGSVIAEVESLGYAPPVSTLGKVTYLNNDHLGSPVVATDSFGDIVWRRSYEAYGVVAEEYDASQNYNGTLLSFTGHIQDYSSDLIYMGARFYNPELGRFQSPDPVYFIEENVQSFNRYAYANNNPYKYIDPDGRLPVVVVAIAVWGVVEIALGAYDAYETVSILTDESASAEEKLITGALAASSFVLPGGGYTVFSRGGRSLPFKDSDRLFEVNNTLDRIESGGPFLHRSDGAIFRNREGKLPEGNYREYTVDTPGATNRGARRIVQDADTGGTYYTDDHYRNFIQIDPIVR